MTNIVSHYELKELSYKDQVRFALFCAYQLKSRWINDYRCTYAIHLIELWLSDKITQKEIIGVDDIISTISYTPNSFAHQVIAYTLRTICFPDSSISYVQYVIMYTLQHGSDIDFAYEQRKYYNDLRYIDENFERIVLEGNV
jgi:hypothetical protein